MTIRNEYVPVPRFIQDTPRGRMEWDPYSRLANDRIIFLGTPVDDTVALVESAEDHVTTRPARGFPPASAGVAVSCFVWPT